MRPIVPKTRQLRSDKNGLDAEDKKISKIFGSYVFNRVAMKEFLNKDAYNAVIEAMENGTPIRHEVADLVAAGMKNWAMQMGATHYTHWFQPLTGATAEKHDAFYKPSDDSNVIESFSVNELVQNEPDASSFPSGGLRTTFEARGYTVWDPSSPAFILETGKGRTLCIPTIFISYTGESLDLKSPLLKSLRVLDNAATKVCQLFNPDISSVKATLGWEQEYFVIDESYFEARPDLMLSGRTLFGHAPAKGQQLEDHYFGSIPERVYNFMVDFETECLRLGIPIKTRHNEVAPAQFECAPHFEEVNIATDHNQLLMDVMDKVARRHHLRVLLHEKPFAGVNGSGKHCNWSMADSKGKNLLDPGADPLNNLRFLTFFINIIKAVHEHAPLLRATIASAGNDHRLGANEAPPAIISVFTGTYLADVLDKFEKGEAMEIDVDSSFNMQIPSVPTPFRDNTDRNRTSPFAFTGNKFEFRAVGSSANVAVPLISLNTMVADRLMQFHTEVQSLIDKGQESRAAIIAVLRRYVTESRPIIFNGNNYSEEWAQEAAKRGLENIKTTPEALETYLRPQTADLLAKHGIFSLREIHSRYELRLENYAKKISIEAALVEEIVGTQILPAAAHYVQSLTQSIVGLQQAGVASGAVTLADMAREVTDNMAAIRRLMAQLTKEKAAAEAHEHPRDQAQAFCHKVRPLMDAIRTHVDALEFCVDDKLWPLPKYRELLFLR